MKVILSKLIICLIALLLLVTAMQTYFVPDQMLERFSINYAGSAGLSTIRGDLGGLFLSITVFLLLGLRSQQRYWLLAAVMVMLFVALGRVIGMFLDEFTQHVFTLTAVEVVMAVLVSAAYIFLRQLDNDDRKVVS